ncbi:MAG: hypothetical protein FD163_2524 [Hyphomonadaceae bacterium]|nr:MAG: hypothetical protein FD128_743 [Hyphomonadaceae bacterium]KAF0182734.1 MAG: hypothetical protein FD163_2524 [Hyphomonadaceae bacterium]
MHKIYYPAILEQGDGEIGIFFPDLPGCVSGGYNEEEAVFAAEEALALHIQGMLEEGLPLPPPSRLKDIARDPDIEELGRVLVGVETSTKKIRININMDESLIAAIDVASTNRSEFISKAARQALAG